MFLLLWGADPSNFQFKQIVHFRPLKFTQRPALEKQEPGHLATEGISVEQVYHYLPGA
jgi:hypothetical protein